MHTVDYSNLLKTTKERGHGVIVDNSLNTGTEFES